MQIRFCALAILMLFPRLNFAQELMNAEKFRISKEFINTLSVFKELQLVVKPNQPIIIYRLIIAPTFYHPLSIRIEQNGHNYLLVAKSLSGQGGYDWGNLKKEKHRKLSKKEWQKLTQLIHEASFWTEAIIEKKAEPNEKGEEEICLDSTSWTLEGLDDGRYHLVHRYCPDLKGVKTVGLYIVKLTGWNIKESNFR